MVQILKGLALLATACGVLGALFFLIAEHSFGAALYWFVSGVVPGIVLYAIGLILEYVEHLSTRLHVIEQELRRNHLISDPSPPKLGNSKADLDKLKGFKI